MKSYATDLMDKFSVSDAKAIKKLTGIIRKDLLAYYGVTALEEIPKHEYSVAMHWIGTWNNMRVVREIVKEARNREEEAENALVGGLEPSANPDGTTSLPGAHD